MIGHMLSSTDGLNLSIQRRRWDGKEPYAVITLILVFMFSYLGIVYQSKCDETDVIG